MFHLSSAALQRSRVAATPPIDIPSPVVPRQTKRKQATGSTVPGDSAILGNEFVILGCVLRLGEEGLDRGAALAVGLPGDLVDDTTADAVGQRGEGTREWHLVEGDGADQDGGSDAGMERCCTFAPFN